MAMDPQTFANLNPSTQAATINAYVHLAWIGLREIGYGMGVAVLGPNWRYWNEWQEIMRKRIGADTPWGLPYPGSSPTPRAFATSYQEAAWLAADLGLTPVSEDPFDICCQIYTEAYEASEPEA
jgi:hypothetical protein